MPVDLNKEPHGFAGLEALVSKIPDDLIVKIAVKDNAKSSPQDIGDKAGNGPAEQSSHANESSPSTGTPVPDSWRAPDSGDAKAWIWVLSGIAALIFFAWFLDEDGGQRSVSTSTAPQSRPSLPTQKPNHERAPSTSPIPQTSTTHQSTRTYVKPSVGRNNVLSISEIRWCERESIRIDAIRPIAISNADVERFNVMVVDYNLRCGSFRYRQGSLESARRDVRADSAQIRTEAIRDFRSQSSTRGAVSPNVETVREVQRLLTALGYQPGPIDGSYGPKTASAIREYQRDQRIQVDGQINQGLVSSLRLEMLIRGRR